MPRIGNEALRRLYAEIEKDLSEQVVDGALKDFRWFSPARREGFDSAAISTAKRTARQRLVAIGAAEALRSLFESWARTSSLDLYSTAMRRLWGMSGGRGRTDDLPQRIRSAPGVGADQVESTS